MVGFDVGAYVPRVLLARTPDAPRHWRDEGSLVFADVSGFTRLSDQLARRGHEGAEDLISTLVRIFTMLLSASDDGGDLIKFGGDAMAIHYSGPHHELRACHAADMMQRVMRVIGNVELTGARTRLRMSVARVQEPARSPPSPLPGVRRRRPVPGRSPRPTTAPG